jgi:hypothetical protein
MPRQRTKNRGGRPCRLTTETALRLGAAIGQRHSITQAARTAGVGTSSVYRWLALGRAGDARFSALARLAESRVSPWDEIFRRYSPRTVFRAVDTMIRTGEL